MPVRPSGPTSISNVRGFVRSIDEKNPTPAQTLDIKWSNPLRDAVEEDNTIVHDTQAGRPTVRDFDGHPRVQPERVGLAELLDVDRLQQRAVLQRFDCVVRQPL